MNRRTFLKLLAGAVVVSAPTTQALFGLLKKAELTPEQANSLHFIRKYEADLSRQQEFSYFLHNELRHYWGSFSEFRSLYHADIILGHHFMDSYMMRILADWHDTRNENAYDLDRAIASLDRRAQAYPQLQFLQAACWLRIGLIYLNENELFGQAKPYFERAANIVWRPTDDELVENQARYYTYKARQLVTFAENLQQTSFDFYFHQPFNPGITG